MQDLPSIRFNVLGITPPDLKPYKNDPCLRNVRRRPCKVIKTRERILLLEARRKEPRFPWLRFKRRVSRGLDEPTIDNHTYKVVGELEPAVGERFTFPKPLIDLRDAPYELMAPVIDWQKRFWSGGWVVKGIVPQDDDLEDSDEVVNIGKDPSAQSGKQVENRPLRTPRMFRGGAYEYKVILEQHRKCDCHFYWEPLHDLKIECKYRPPKVGTSYAMAHSEMTAKFLKKSGMPEDLFSLSAWSVTIFSRSKRSAEMMHINRVWSKAYQQEEKEFGMMEWSRVVSFCDKPEYIIPRSLSVDSLHTLFISVPLNQP